MGGVPSNSGNVPNRVFVHRAPGAWLQDGALWTCSIQSSPPTIAAALADQPRPNAVNTVRELLAGSHPLHTLIGGEATPCLITLPELSFGSEDWEALDQLVREYPCPIILLAGFGYSLGAWIEDWLLGDSLKTTTQRHKSWPDEWQLVRHGRYNGGWCWLHRKPGDTECVVFLKNRPEVRHEARAIPDLRLGRYILRIDTDDTTLFPQICADLLADGEQSPTSRALESLARNSALGRRVLLVGLLWETTPSHKLWQQAIGRVFDTGKDHLIAYLNNHRTSGFATDEEIDKWRTLTGLFVEHRRLLKRPQPPISFLRYANTASFSALLLRDTAEGVFLGRISWQPGPTEGDFWSPAGFHPILADGSIGERVQLDTDSYELQRFIHRYGGIRNDQLSDAMKGLVQQSLSDFIAALGTKGVFSAGELWTSLLHGVRLASESARGVFPEADDIFNTYDELWDGLCVMSMIMMIDKCEYNSTPRQHGQLKIRDAGCGLLIWADPSECEGKMADKLIAWSNQLNLIGAPQRLLVLGKGRRGNQPEGLVSPSRLSDITAGSPSGTARDISEVRENVIYWRSLRQIENQVYNREPVDKQAFVSALQQLLSDSLTRMSNVVESMGAELGEAGADVREST